MVDRFLALWPVWLLFGASAFALFLLALARAASRPAPRPPSVPERLDRELDVWGGN